MSAPAPADTSAEDLALVERVRAGDRECFYTLVGRYERGLFRAVLALLHNLPDTEEVVQETFLRALRHLDQFRGEAKFQTWLTQIALNSARMKLRKAHAGMWESIDEPVPSPEGPVPRQVPDWRENPEQEVGREQRAALLRQALRGMPKDYREVLVLRDIQMLSTQEAAQVLGISLASVKTRLLRARLQLRGRLEGALQPAKSGRTHE